MTRAEDSGSSLDNARDHCIKRTLCTHRTGRESLLAVVNAVRAGRDALRARYMPGVADPNVSAEQRAWRGGYLAGWQDAYLACQIAAAQSSAAIADREDASG